MVLEEFLHTALMYQVKNTRNINAVAVLEHALSLLKKNNGVTFCIVCECAISLSPVVISNKYNLKRIASRYL